VADTPELFDAIAREYDWWSTLLSAGGFRAWHRAALDLLDLGPGLRVLDVGCGTGEATRLIALRVGPTGSVTGLDPSEGMLTTAEMEPVPEGAAPVQWVRGAAEALPFADAAFDRVTAMFSLRNARNVPAAIAEIVRVSRPNARLVLLDLVQPTTAVGSVAWGGLRAAIRALPPAQRASYRWLAVSLRHAPTAREWHDLLAVHGVVDITMHHWLGGLVALMTGRVARRAQAAGDAGTVPVIVWAVDGSWTARRGQDWIGRHLAPGAQVHVVTVIPPIEVADAAAETDRTAWRHHWEQAVESLAGYGYDVVPRLLEGEPGPALVAYAQSVGATTLVVGWKRRSALAEHAFGGVWSQVLSHAPCPVVALTWGD
jgi:demethylmenaquinone methyltransferase/2-methoxy-6-polyprenyl-1,4-benzoquinol methylase